MKVRPDKSQLYGKTVLGLKNPCYTNFYSEAVSAKVAVLFFSVLPPSRLPLRVHPAQGVSTAGVEDVLVQKEARFGWVAVDVEEAEAGVFKLLEQAEPVPHHGRVIAAHLKARPVQVKLQQQLTH